MKKESRKLLVSGLKEYGITPDEDHINAFDIYLSELLKWNSKYNLTAITDEKQIIIKHFLDSAIISMKTSCECGKMVDIGSGAGFPGLVLKILRPEIAITSVDSNEKKIFFQKNVIRKLGINHISFVADRVDSVEFIKEHKNQFDCAVARAFKKLSEVLTLAYPIVKKGGFVSVFKGKNYEQDIDELKGRTINKRFKLLKIDSYSLPSADDRQHHILIYKKN